LNNFGFGIAQDGTVQSVAGDLLGNGPGGPVTPTSPVYADQSNAWSRTQRAGLINITALYASWAQEFGQLVVGRTPIHFGLGTAYNAGKGQFDHYIDTKDLIGYKFVLGNLFVLPMLGKISEGALGAEDDVDDYMVHVQYDNPETELSLGGFYQLRVVTGNDAPINPNLGGAGSTRLGSYKNTLMSLFFSQKLGRDFRMGVEADLLSGDTGVVNPAGQGISLNSFGIAGEFSWAPVDGAWGAGLKAGIASGDDPGSADVYEGFAFSRNYDVGFLMFNHPLGQRDFLRTGLYRPAQSSATPAAGERASEQIDTEAISNAVYLAPNVTYRQRENLSYGATVVYGMLNKDPLRDVSNNAAGTSSNLGFELDLNVTYKPFERMTWITEAGVLLPGDAWKGGSTNLDNSLTYGIVTKAAINF
jgi:hypothetical protein